MPRGVAVATTLAGAAVIFFGASYARSTPATPSEQAPHVTLEPVRSGDPDAPRDVVHGVVLMTDGSAASGVRVDLVALVTDEGARTRSAETDADGAFVFTDVDVTPGTPYVADARFDDATFPSEVLRVGRGIDDPVRIVVARTTSKPSQLALDVESIAIVGDARGMQVVHAVTVRNGGSRAYVGGLRLPLVPGASAIDPRDGLDRRRLELIGGELVSSAPVVPGRHDITYTYVAPMEAGGLTIRHEVRYPTKRFELLVGGELDAHRTDASARSREIEIGPRGNERPYRQQQFRDLGPRESLTFAVSVKGSSPLLRIAGLVAAAAVALAIIGFPLVRRRRAHATPAVENESLQLK